MTAVLLRGAAPAPGRSVDLLLDGGQVSVAAPPRDVEEVHLGGRPTLPGLADHHLHLMALAASWDSVDCSPAALASNGGLAPTLRAARRRRPHGWLRAVGYDVAASGELDRRGLDDIGVGPVRVQDRTGIRWMLDSFGLRAVLPPDGRTWPDGVERDAAGQATGVLVRLDAWLGGRVPRSAPDLDAVSRWLADRGVTSVTDAGARNGPDELTTLAAAGLCQRLTVMTAAAGVTAPRGVELGPVKVLLDDDDLPGLGALRARIEEAHRSGRAVAVHCVTETQLVLALAAGVDRRDRIEHASLVPADVLPLLVASDPTVVVQPGLVPPRGDRYLAETDPRDHPSLHRLRSLLGAGLRVAASSDAPYGPADPWVGIAAAVERRTSSGSVLGADEALTPAEALGLFLGAASDPGRRRALRPGAAADVVVLDDDWDALGSSPRVWATFVGGRRVAGPDPGGRRDTAADARGRR